MGTLGIVDTSVVISYLRDVDPVADQFESLLRNNFARFSAVTVFELKLGERENERPGLDVLFEKTKVVPFDESVAKIAAEIYGELEHSGQRIGLRDTFIAATALSRDLPVYTLNTEHFKRVADLEVLSFGHD